jgi:hypothetical protein
MRRRFWLVAVGAAATLIFAAVPFAATGSDSARLVLSERMQLTGPNTQQGTFVAAGAINDAGSASATFSVTPAAPGRGALHGTHVLEGAGGTITLDTRAVVFPFPPPNPPRAWARGKWTIVDATGDYAGITGDGAVYATADFTTGEITIIRDGKVSGAG